MLSIRGFYSLSDRTCYLKISLNIDAPRLGLDLSNRSEIWQTSRQQRCRNICRISERCDHYNIHSSGFESWGDFAVKRLTAWWIEAQLINFIQLHRNTQWYHKQKQRNATFRCMNLPMMTSSNGIIFRVTGTLCGEFTGHRWIPGTKASDAELCFSLICAWIYTSVNIRKAGDLRRHRAHYGVIVMHWNSLVSFNTVHSEMPLRAEHDAKDRI